LLRDDPFYPQISSLPAAVLWKSSSFLWLFESIYCTRESLEGERRAAIEMGWASGQIFQDLESLGILKSINWQTDLSDVTKNALRLRHAQLREIHSQESIRALVRA